jgi:hypothetical protein
MDLSMSAAANIVVNDGQGTPAAHTFIPIGPDSSGTWWFEEQTGVPLLNRRISVSLTFNGPSGAGSNAGAQTYRAKIGIHLPTGETLGTSDNGLTPPPTVAYVLRSQHEFLESGRSTLAERSDLLAFAKNVLADTQIVDLVKNQIRIF